MNPEASMNYERYLELQRADLARLEDNLTCVNLAFQTRHAMYARGNLQRQIETRREVIAIVEREMSLPH
jgi:hypothetical protein